MLIKNLHSLFFQAGTGCVSDCIGCKRQFSKKNKDFESMLYNLNMVHKNKIFGNTVMIYNIDFFSFTSDEIMKILSFKNSFKTISFHTDFENIDFDKLYKDINFVYQKHFSLREIKFILNFLNLRIPNNVLISYRCTNFLLVGKLIKVLKGNNFKIKNINKDDTCLEFYIGDNIHFKFFITTNERYKINRCYFKNFLNIYNNEVIFTEDFYLGYLEVQLNGDIRIHEPPCGFGDIVITNIQRDKNKIIQDFKSFSKYINSFNNSLNGEKQFKICNICKTKKYSYEH